MWASTREIVADTVRDFLRLWKTLARTDIVYKVVSFALLTPAAVLLLRWAMSRAGTRVVADTEIATFLLTTPIGLTTLIAAGAITTGITALEMSCLMGIGVAAAKGRHLTVRGALAFGASHAARVLALAAHMVVRVLAALVPFLLIAGLTYLWLLRRYDINYYLAERPPAFWGAAAIIVAIVAALAALIVRTITRWALALPLVLFEDVLPRHALGESARRSTGARGVIAIALAAWAIVASALLAAATMLPDVIGRSLAPTFARSLALLLTFIMVLALVVGVLGLLAAIVNASLFALTIVRLYLRSGEPKASRIPGAETMEGARAAALLTGPARIGVAAIAVLTLAGVVLLGVIVAGRNQPVVVIAHRGSSETAPENTLAAFRLAVEQRADFVELDVQESLDGEVVVMHDADLMRVGRSPHKVWEANAADLRAIDIGSYVGSQFSNERVPTLAEALAVCKGGSRVIVELKSYGHDQRLEEKVAAIVEASGMVNDTIFMSLDHDMVRRMKMLRPEWRVGVLVAKALGDLTSLEADFYAVEARLATRSMVRQAHRAGRDVYVWTVNDPAWMLSAMSHGVDGLITDKPEVARLVVARRAGMSDAQRILVALLVRLGARTEVLAREDALRP
jgi:glycerophosphoryl diester phosphodiesterase